MQALNVGGTLTDSFNYTVRTARVACHGDADDHDPRRRRRAGGGARRRLGDRGRDTTAGSNATGNVLTNDTDVDTPHAALVVQRRLAGTAGTSAWRLPAPWHADAQRRRQLQLRHRQYQRAVQALNVGGTLTDSFNYQVSDGQGGVASATLTVTIHGTDDYVPAISGLVITETAISFVANDLDNATLSLVSPFASAFGDP